MKTPDFDSILDTCIERLDLDSVPTQEQRYDVASENYHASTLTAGETEFLQFSPQIGTVVGRECSPPSPVAVGVYEPAVSAKDRDRTCAHEQDLLVPMNARGDLAAAGFFLPVRSGVNREHEGGVCATAQGIVPHHTPETSQGQDVTARRDAQFFQSMPAAMLSMSPEEYRQMHRDHILACADAPVFGGRRHA